MTTSTQTVNITLSIEQLNAINSIFQNMNISPIEINDTKENNTEENNTEENVLPMEETDCEDEGEYFEVKEVINWLRPTDNSCEKFLVRFNDNSTEWVDSKHCNCDKLISKYLKENNIKTVFCFCRVSSKGQTGPGHVSLEAQESELRNAAKIFDDAHVVVIKTVKSAHRSIPRDLKNMVENANPGDVVYFYRTDRLSRDVIGFVGWIHQHWKRGVKFYSLKEDKYYSGSDDVDFLGYLLDAKKESVKIGERVKMSIKYRREKGTYKYALPWGKKRVNGEVVDDPEAITIKEQILTCTESDDAMAKKLNQAGQKKKGREWSPAMVAKIRKSAVPTQPKIQGKRTLCVKKHRLTSTKINTRLQAIKEIIKHQMNTTNCKAVSRTRIKKMFPNFSPSFQKIPSDIEVNRILSKAVANGELVQFKDSFKISKRRG